MSAKDFDTFLLQILVKNFVLSYQPSLKFSKFEAVSPTINLKIHEGPTIMIPYLSKEDMHIYSKAQQSGYNHPPIKVEEAILRGGIYNFDKGKSCLFTNHYEIKPKIRFRIEVTDGLVFPSTIIGSSCVIERDFKKTPKTQTLLEEPLKIYNDKETELGMISIIIRMESIDSEDQLNPDVSKTHCTNKSFKTFRMKTLDYGISQKEKVIQEDDKTLNQSSGSEIRSDLGNKNHLQASKSFKHKVRRDNISQTKPTGWLRSTPVFKNNCTKADPSGTRTSFLRLYKTYPDLEKHVNNEVERQLREKAKLIESILQQKFKNASKDSSTKGLTRKYYNSRAKSNKGLQTENKLKINKSLQTEYKILTDKETTMGDSLIENIVKPIENIGKPRENIGKPIEKIGKPIENIGKPTENIGKPIENIGKPEVLQTISDESKNSLRSLCYSPTFNDSIEESIESMNSNPKSSRISSESDSMKSNNLIDSKKLSSINGNHHSNGKSSTPHKQDMRTDDKLTIEEISKEKNLSNSQPKDKILQKIISDEIISVENDINNEAEEEVPSLNCDLNSYLQKSVERQLLKQSSKTSSSIYPQSSEERVQLARQLATVQQRSSSEDMEGSIRDLSEKIANILKPKTESVPSIHTDSISSFIPSNLSEAYSSLTDF
ncbi:UNVERIFIED_CONTAM: hypothetical protein RMT77_000213 [Armadillidium vulgare]